MKLSKNNWIVRWAYWLDDDVPNHTNVCALFWRVILVKPILALFAGAIVYLLFLMFPLIAWWEWRDRLKKEKKIGLIDVIRQRVSDWKSKTCTRVEIVDEN